jgi:hypothetical protein
MEQDNVGLLVAQPAYIRRAAYLSGDNILDLLDVNICLPKIPQHIRDLLLFFHGQIVGNKHYLLYHNQTPLPSSPHRLSLLEEP